MERSLWVALAMFTTSLTNPAQAFNPDLDCAAEPRLRSQSSDAAATMTFRTVGENDETSAKIYWIDFDGNRVFYKQLFATESWTVNTYLTHPWVITFPEPGGPEVCGGIFLPSPGQRTVIIN